jgi:predicted metal-dependent hydrolase
MHNSAMEQLYFDTFFITIKRSRRRKTVALQIKQGAVIARVPHNVPLTTVRDFAEQKTAWITAKLAQYQAPTPQQFVDGEAHLYLGESYPLQITTAAAHSEVHFEQANIHILSHQHQPSMQTLKNQLRKAYREQAERYLSLRVEQLAEVTGLRPQQLQIKTYRARWGSCSADGRVQLNWKLILAPPNIIDYVIVHELCHLEQHNHSPAFWELVASFYPDWQQARSWLKEHNQQLDV